MSHIAKCPECNNEAEQGFIFSPRRICWSESADSILADFGSEVLVKDAILKIRKIPAIRCEQCNLVTFKYK